MDCYSFMLIGRETLGPNLIGGQQATGKVYHELKLLWTCGNIALTHPCLLRILLMVLN